MLRKTRPHVRLLQRLLDEPRLLTRVQSLAPSALVALLDEVGLEDASEVVSLATTEQLVGVFDRDVWASPRPGVDEQLDAARFALWLEVLVEAGAAFAARTVSALPEELVTSAFDELLFVLDVDALAVQAESGMDVETVNDMLDASDYLELDQYLLVWRGAGGWDAMVSVLMELDSEHSHLLQRILAQCCAACTERMADDGLYEVLSAHEQLASDAAAERGDRLVEQGFVAPSDATSFLRLARQSSISDILSTPRDPVAHAYFRELTVTPWSAADAAPSADAFAALPQGADAPPPRESLRAALASLRTAQPAVFRQRMEELAFLVNVVIAGCGIDGRRVRPAEAADIVIHLSDIGLERLLASLGDDAESALVEHGIDQLFRVGWQLLGHESPTQAPWSRLPEATRELLAGLVTADVSG